MKPRLNQNLECVRESFNTHHDIKNINSRMNSTNLILFLNLVLKNSFWKENKASQKSDVLIKVIKTNINIIFYMLYHNFSISKVDSVFPSKVKEPKLHLFIKRKNSWIYFWYTYIFDKFLDKGDVNGILTIVLTLIIVLIISY